MVAASCCCSVWAVLLPARIAPCLWLTRRPLQVIVACARLFMGDRKIDKARAPPPPPPPSWRADCVLTNVTRDMCM